MKKYFLTIMFVLSASLVQAQVKGSDILGIWYSHADEASQVSIVEIFEYQGKYYAYGMGYKNESQNDIKFDVNNPDPLLRSRKINEVVFLYDVSFNPQKSQWENGEIYRPGDGKYFYISSGKLSDDLNTLTWRTSVDKKGLLGANLEWTRVENPKVYESRKTPRDILIKNIPMDRKKK